MQWPGLPHSQEVSVALEAVDKYGLQYRLHAAPAIGLHAGPVGPPVCDSRRTLSIPGWLQGSHSFPV